MQIVSYCFIRYDSNDCVSIPGLLAIICGLMFIHLGLIAIADKLFGQYISPSATFIDGCIAEHMQLLSLCRPHCWWCTQTEDLLVLRFSVYCNRVDEMLVYKAEWRVSVLHMCVLLVCCLSFCCEFFSPGYLKSPSNFVSRESFFVVFGNRICSNKAPV